jgi:hypothetical protein
MRNEAPTTLGLFANSTQASLKLFCLHAKMTFAACIFEMCAVLCCYHYDIGVKEYNIPYHCGKLMILKKWVMLRAIREYKYTIQQLLVRNIRYVLFAWLVAVRYEHLFMTVEGWILIVMCTGVM